MPIFKTKNFILRTPKNSDANDIAKNANDAIIYRNTISIPYPYGIRDARKWLKKIIPENRKKKPQKVNFAIEINHEVVGIISLEKINFRHRAEIGYWLACQHRGRGIMAQAAKIVTNFGFKKLKLKRIYAHVLASNKASQKTLEKVGYKLEGILRKHEKKDRKINDLCVYGKLA